MRKYVTGKNVAVLARLAALGLLAYLTVDVSPALAATLSRGADVSATLSAVWSMMGPFWSSRNG